MDLKHPPQATYRLQFNKQFTFKHAAELIEYLHQLGISHCYSSPIAAAKPGSMHGYDMVDSNRINPEIGSLADFEHFANALHRSGMFLILDIVPNHMYIGHSSNQWWQDVLENGPSSPYAEYFDIDWTPSRSAFNNKVLLPLLDQQYGSALENQILSVGYANGAFYVELHEIKLPTDPKSWNSILESLADEVQKILPTESEGILELNSILIAIDHLPSGLEKDKEKVVERLSEKESIKKRLDTLFRTHHKIFDLLGKQLELFNGIKADPLSFDPLEKFLNMQFYRLCFWRVANDEINFRRFFDIVDYAGIRTENPEVFKATHALASDLVQKKWVDGLRIDHIDGLWDPEEYLLNLRQCSEQSLYVIAEKILTGNEKLRREWLLHGTVGYDFLNQLNGVFVSQANKEPILDIYKRFTGIVENPLEQTFYCKKLILKASLSSELNILARRLNHIAEGHRSSRDFTKQNLRMALSDIIVYFSVYRSYIRANIGLVHEEDRQYIQMAIARSKRRNPVISGLHYDFIRSVLLLEHPPGLEEELKKEREEFVMRFQQLTGPVMAKGLEDTAFYRFFPLASLNEVGANIRLFGIDLDTFHKNNIEKLEFWPHSMLATSTHDTKRSEDVRARINVLSEIPSEWEQALIRWSKTNLPFKVTDEEELIPDPNEEYLLYQTLVGTWPLSEMDSKQHSAYVERIQMYMEKAIREAKIYTTWLNPNAQHESAMKDFVEKVLNSDAFLIDFKQFAFRISMFGMLNSLSQTLLKLTSPGVPDIYQGNEIWNFDLVDPDNRGLVDFSLRTKLLQGLIESPSVLKECLENPYDGRIKMLIIKKTLELRNKNPELFSQGIYLPLYAKGKMQNHVIAFARIHESQMIIVVACRFFTHFMRDFQNPLEEDVWKGTCLELPPEFADRQFTNVFTGNIICADNSALSLQMALQPLTIAILHSL